MDRSADDWQELAKREPYFAVLTDERFLTAHTTPEARKAFFATGEADVAALLAQIGFAPKSALDFGCGVGRLTIPLANRVERVVGYDVAPAMLEIARRNAAETGVGNVMFTTELEGSFELICSLIVFQHIPVARGMELLAKLASMLEPGGVAALHITFRRPGGRVRRIARGIRARFRFVHRIASKLAGDRRGLPYMQMNEYDENEVARVFAAAGCSEVNRTATSDGGIEGAVLLVRRY